MLAPWIVGAFTSEPEVARVGTLALRIIGLGFPLYAFGMVITQSFNGAGDTWTPTWINLFVFWLLEIPLAYVLSMHTTSGAAASCDQTAYWWRWRFIVIFRRHMENYVCGEMEMEMNCSAIAGQCCGNCVGIAPHPTSAVPYGPRQRGVILFVTT
jgi:hypothetical protein